ncbi:hypothetical protein POM88_004549 [Heracleum sosnowskyi]|uniref:Uncharacterized protein n=1 Tax=Heracleum sosnowskyi TaxID=360622 RepID=A0AAD8NCN3_9APIA|nr:hypothetical protein POM88_004549 [Heracleum sosnowskyi]
MMMTLTENPADTRFLEWCCCSVATGLAIGSSLTRSTKHIEYGPSKFNSCRIINRSVKFRPLRLQAHQFNRGGTISRLSKRSSSLEICAAAFNSTCLTMETEPLTRRQRQTAATVLSPLGGKSKSPPSLDDGGNKLPPRGGGGDDGVWKFSFIKGQEKRERGYQRRKKRTVENRGQYGLSRVVLSLPQEKKLRIYVIKFFKPQLVHKKHNSYTSR